MVKKWKLGLGAACLAGALLLTVPISSSASDDVKISEAFPDAVFQSYVSGARIDKDQNGFLTQEEMDDVVKIDLYKKGVKNLSGIEYFGNLRELDVANNELTTLDLSGNTKLLFLNCEENALKKLDLSNSPEIVSIVAHNNQLENVYLPKRDEVGHEAGTPMIKLTGNPNLRFVDMRYCPMYAGGYGEEAFDATTIAIYSSYDLGFNKVNGKWIYLADTGEFPETIATEKGWFKQGGKRYYADDDGYLYTGKKTINGKEYYFNPKGVLQENIDWDKVAVMIDEKTFPNGALRDYVADHIDKNEDGLLSKEEIDAVTSIVFWWREDSNNGRLDGIEMFTNLQTLECGGNGLTSLNVSMFKNLTYLNCSYNQLTSLDVTGLTKLRELRCNGNKLTKLDVSRNKELVELYCDNNQLKSLDLNNLKKLNTLRCAGNELTALNLSVPTALKTLECENNLLVNLDVSKNAELSYLYCDNNKLTALNVSNLTELEWLSCGGNRLTSIDVSKNKNLEMLSCWKNKLTSLKLAGASSLSYLCCYGNPLKHVNVYGVPRLVTTFQKGDVGSWTDSGILVVSYDYYYGEYNEETGTWEDWSGRIEVDSSIAKKIITAQTGWITKNKKMYYYDEDAKLVKGKKTIGNATYYLDPTTGERKTGWQTISEKKYYFDPQTGKMKNGLQTINKKKYYFDPKTGEMKTGIQTVNKKKYYFDPKTGEMKTGWQTVSSKKYYFAPKTGEMKTGIQTINKNKYYFAPKTGEMKTGWQTISKKKYYFKANGVMAKNEYIKGIYLNKKGVRSNKAKCTWRKYKKGKKYGNAKGWFAKGVTITIDGKKYTFKKNGYVK